MKKDRKIKSSKSIKLGLFIFLSVLSLSLFSGEEFNLTKEVYKTSQSDTIYNLALLIVLITESIFLITLLTKIQIALNLGKPDKK